jgi:hypothetical protein
VGCSLSGSRCPACWVGMSAAPAMARQNARRRAPISRGPEPTGSSKTNAQTALSGHLVDEHGDVPGRSGDQALECLSWAAISRSTRPRLRGWSSSRPEASWAVTLEGRHGRCGRTSSRVRRRAGRSGSPLVTTPGWAARHVWQDTEAGPPTMGGQVGEPTDPVGGGPLGCLQPGPRAPRCQSPTASPRDLNHRGCCGALLSLDGSQSQLSERPEQRLPSPRTVRGVTPPPPDARSAESAGLAICRRSTTLEAEARPLRANPSRVRSRRTKTRAGAGLLVRAWTACGS